MLKVTWFAIVAAILFLRIQIARFIRWAFGMPEPIIRVTKWRVVRAYLIRECPGDDYDWAFKNITDLDIDYSHPDWKLAVRDAVPPEWTGWRLELRCQRGPSKKRIVVRSNEDMQFPQECISAARRRSMRGRSMLSSATLATPSGKFLDVTDRVKKYITSQGRVLRARDLFPLDDVESLIIHNEYIALHITYLNGSSKEIRCRFDDEWDMTELFHGIVLT